MSTSVSYKIVVDVFSIADPWWLPWWSWNWVSRYTSKLFEIVFEPSLPPHPTFSPRPWIAPLFSTRGVMNCMIIWKEAGFWNQCRWISALEYESRGHGFESYSGHFYSHKLSWYIWELCTKNILVTSTICWTSKITIFEEFLIIHVQIYNSNNRTSKILIIPNYMSSNNSKILIISFVINYYLFSNLFEFVDRNRECSSPL